MAAPGKHTKLSPLGRQGASSAGRLRFPLTLGSSAAWAVRSEGPAPLKPGPHLPHPRETSQIKILSPIQTRCLRPPAGMPLPWCLQLRALWPRQPGEAGPRASPQPPCTCPPFPSCSSPAFFMTLFSAPRERAMPLGVGAGWLHLFPGLCPSGFQLLSCISDAFKLLFLILNTEFIAVISRRVHPSSFAMA